MKHKIIHTDSGKRLLLVFAGWGMDAGVFANIRPRGYDVMVVWDYTSPSMPAIPESYEEVCVIAWSMGVYAAMTALATDDRRITLRVAVNGTPWPVSDTEGIPEAIFKGTLDGLSQTSVTKFFRRMCATADDRTLFESLHPARDLEDLRLELSRIYDRVRGGVPADGFRWDVAVIGRDDRIFPARNQEHAWKKASVRTEVIDAGHFFDFNRIVRRYLKDKAVVRSRFEKSSGTYDENAFVQGNIVDKLMSGVERVGLSDVFRRAHEIVEIGPGTGLLTRKMLPLLNDAHLALWDISDYRKIYETFGADIEFVRCDAETRLAQSPNRFYDLIVTSSAVQWFNSPENFIRHCFRALREGGYVLLTTFVAGNMRQLEAFAPATLPLWTGAEWNEAVSDMFDVVHSEEYDVDVTFDSVRQMLEHLKRTGVNALTARSDVPATRRILREYPCDADTGLYTLTYRPLILILKKKAGESR